jgi:hypothetical protein
MKHTKKMIMVPEAEWLTMLNMLKGSEPLARAKANTEIEMSKVLKDPKISEDLKGKKWNWLFKQKRQLKKEIDEDNAKPQKIVIDPDQLNTIKADVAKYLGVAPTKPQRPRPITNVRKIRRLPRPKERVFEEEEEEEEENFHDASDTFNEPPVEKPTTSKRYIIHPNYRDDLIKAILKGHTGKLELDKRTKTIGGIQGSDYEEIVDYLTDINKPVPVGTDFFLSKMKKEPIFKKALNWADQHRQAGEGKRKKRKTPPNFKPMIWARL